jgi:two-component system chemotaxis response regulator CheB
VIRVLVVEDSAVVRLFLERVLSSDPEIQVVASAKNGEEAVALVARLRPDLITMDINMTAMDGFEATRRIMESFPAPIVLVSASWDSGEIQTTFRAIEAGAVAVLAKPRGGPGEHGPEARELIRTVKLMSEVKVVKRWPRQRGPQVAPQVSPAPASTDERPQRIQIVALGASTGGPPAVKTILSTLPASLPVPVLVVQHIASGFASGFASWLAGASKLPVRVAAAGEPLRAGQVYVAPDDRHLGLGRGPQVELSEEAPENGVRPSVSFLFRAVARVFGGKAAAVLLSGMGADGAAELKLLREAGAATFAQDESSSVVFGMPAEAVRLGAARYVQPPEAIAATLQFLLRSP